MFTSDHNKSINHFNGKKTSYIKSFWPIPTVDIVKSFYEKKLIVILHFSGLWSCTKGIISQSRWQRPTFFYLTVIYIKITMICSYRPFVHLWCLVMSRSSSPGAQFGSYLTHRVSLGKGCTVTLNQRSNVRVI